MEYQNTFSYGILPLDFDSQQGTRIYKNYNLVLYENIILYFYSSLCEVGESSLTQRSCQESEKPAGTDFSPNSKLYIV